VTHDQNLVGNNLDFTADTGFFGMENRFAAQLQASRNWITFVEEGNPNDFPFDTVTVVDPIQGLYGPEFPDTRISRLTDMAGSFEDRLKITPAFALIGGVRVEAITLDRSGTNFDGTVPDGLPFSKTWTPVSYRAAYTYEPIHNLNATAYDPAVAGVFSLTPSSLQLTSTRIYETGAKQQLLDGRAEWTVALYDIVQRNVFVPVNTTTTDLAGEVASKGLEVSAAISPFEGWKLWANSAWTHARFVNFDQWTGNTPPDVAPIIVNAGASYRYEHWRWPMEIGASVRHVGPRFVFQDNLTTMDAYTTADAHRDWPPEPSPPLAVTDDELSLSGRSAYHLANVAERLGVKIEHRHSNEMADSRGLRKAREIALLHRHGILCVHHAVPRDHGLSYHNRAATIPFERCCVCWHCQNDCRQH
jgi:iron complex outermembrane recepter protein